MTELSDFQRRLLNGYQRALPLAARPYAAIAAALQSSEAQVIAQIAGWLDDGTLSRVGAVVEHGIGASTLAALAVPAGRLDEVAAVVNAFTEVNHNYQREHRYNLWFVVTAPNRARVDAVLAEIHAATGLAPLDLPMEQRYRLDTGFAL